MLVNTSNWTIRGTDLLATFQSKQKSACCEDNNKLHDQLRMSAMKHKVSGLYDEQHSEFLKTKKHENFDARKSGKVDSTVGHKEKIKRDHLNMRT